MLVLESCAQVASLSGICCLFPSPRGHDPPHIADVMVDNCEPIARGLIEPGCPGSCLRRISGTEAGLIRSTTSGSTGPGWRALPLPAGHFCVGQRRGNITSVTPSRAGRGSRLAARGVAVIVEPGGHRWTGRSVHPGPTFAGWRPAASAAASWLYLRGEAARLVIMRR